MPVVEKPTPEEALSRVQAVLSGVADRVELNRGKPTVWCSPENLPRVAEVLRDADGLQFRFFTFLSAIDRSELSSAQEAGEQPAGEAGSELPAGGDVHAPPAGKLEVLMHLYSPDHAVHVDVHVPLAGPRCPSVTSIFRGALWHEREAAEFFGIDFEGHPRLVPLYLPEDFEGYPLLKSFKLPTRFVKEWPGAKDPEEAAAGGH